MIESDFLSIISICFTYFKELYILNIINRFKKQIISLADIMVLSFSCFVLYNLEPIIYRLLVNNRGHIFANFVHLV